MMTTDHTATAIRRRQPAPLCSQVTLAALPEAVPWARHHAVAVLRAWRAETELIETVELLVSELMTNALTPGCRPAGHAPDAASPVGLRLSYLAGRVVIEVYDTRPEMPMAAIPESDAEHGRGLLLVTALARRWNVCRVPRGGKVVWCEVVAD